uniref:Uncharacterized protein n=1 Tax=Physcomitrium patens TaxID=3218 RepID=A0A2K1IR36_PHYPA|nr:hypothetical protein PHYPA_025862 [Physcomitrium patens]
MCCAFPVQLRDSFKSNAVLVVSNDLWRGRLFCVIEDHIPKLLLLLHLLNPREVVQHCEASTSPSSGFSLARTEFCYQEFCRVAHFHLGVLHLHNRRFFKSEFQSLKLGLDLRALGTQEGEFSGTNKRISDNFLELSSRMAEGKQN